MNVSLLIARRTASDRDSAQNAMVHIATAAVAVSIAVMIISLSVIFGFREQIARLISGTIADVVVADARSFRRSGGTPVHDNEALRQLLLTTDGVVAIEPFVAESSVIRSATNMEGAILRGIDSTAHLTTYASSIIEGRLPLHGAERRKELALAESCAQRLGLTSGGRVEMLFMREGTTPQREVFKVCGIFATPMEEGRESVALADIATVQRINGWGEQMISGYAVRVADIEQATTTADIINLRLLGEYEGEESISAISSRELYSDIFSWLDTHDINATVIITIMLIVALFNMVTALLILVLERTRMIGILKSLGMANRPVRRIFHYRAAIIIAKGLAWGNAVALALLLLQQHTHLVKLNASGYILSEVPVSLGAGWIVFLNAAFAVVVLMLLTMTTTIVAQVKPSQTLKYE